MANTNRRTGRLTRRQSLALAAVLVAAVALAVAALRGYPEIALVLLGMLGVLGFGAGLQNRRRIEELQQLVRGEHHRIRRYLAEEIRDQVESATQASERAHTAHRRLLATVETERLAAADRHRELVELLDRADAAATGARHLATAGASAGAETAGAGSLPADRA